MIRVRFKEMQGRRQINPSYNDMGRPDWETTETVNSKRTRKVEKEGSFRDLPRSFRDLQ